MDPSLEANPKYKLIASMTEMEKSHQPWNGETGLITQEMLGKHLKGAASPIYYIAGPRHGERFARDVKQSRKE